MHAINGYRRPRPESEMGADELGRVTVPTVFVWGTQDPHLAPRDARPWIEKMPAATLHEVPAGHAPWFEDPSGCGRVVTGHFTATGFPPASGIGSSHPAQPVSSRSWPRSWGRACGGRRRPRPGRRVVKASSQPCARATARVGDHETARLDGISVLSIDGLDLFSI
jgi:hypothetical protein